MVIVAYVPLFFLLSPIGISPNSSSSEGPYEDFLAKFSVDRDSCDNCSDFSGAGCFTALPESGY